MSPPADRVESAKRIRHEGAEPAKATKETSEEWRDTESAEPMKSRERPFKEKKGAGCGGVYL